ncbi:MAG: hypothetical protein ACRDQ2_18750, partial [Gaiellales bacterium]
MSPFVQTRPRLPDAWSSDLILQEALRWHVGDELFRAAEPDLAAMGRAATTAETLDLAMRAENDPPRLIPYSAWGERIDEIE